VETDGKIVHVHELSERQKEEMYSLMCRYYENTFREKFYSDLSEKQWVLMILDSQTHEIAGFSTQVVFPFIHNQTEYQVLFSGDTIIKKEHWGSMTLTLLFGELMIKLIREYEDKNLYWLLISKGLRTYKYLQSFYIDYYPSYKNVTPRPVQSLMHALGGYEFGDLYDETRGIVKATGMGQYLKEEYHAAAKASKSHEIFFCKANPGYIRGDELLCLTRLSFDNINPYISRVISKYI